MTTPPAAPSPSPEMFAARFCRHFAVPAECYEREMLRRSHYPHARLVYFLSSGEAFAADRDFVTCVGRLTRRRDLPGEAMEFHDDPANRYFWRRFGRVRISVQRVHALFNTVWP